MHRIPRFLALLLTLLLWSSLCFAGELPLFTPSAVPTQPDYADDSNWLAITYTPRHAVDVFWVYPTVLHDQEHWLMPTDRADMQTAARQTLTSQASVFSCQTNLYAPMYRQMNLAGLYKPEKEQTEMLRYGMEDVWRAFNYYMHNLNQGRPFILAGHSQGSNILTNLIKKHWGTLGYEDRLVAAYLIGWSVTADDLAKNTALRMCSDRTELNCIISYNTMAEGRQKAAPTLLPGAVATNPLSWSTEGALAPAKLNAGARFFNADGTHTDILHYTSAQIVDGGLVVHPKDKRMDQGDGGFPEGVYHGFDYSLFYMNLVDNVAERNNAFLKAHP